MFNFLNLTSQAYQYVKTHSNFHCNVIFSL